MINNPDTDSASLRVGIKAYGNPTSNTIYSDKRLFGWAEIENAFAIGSTDH